MTASDLRTRIRSLQVELAPLMAEHRMNLLGAALQKLHEMGLRVAVPGVNGDGTPRPEDGALNFFVRSCPTDQRAHVSKLLDDLSDEHVWLFLWHADERAEAQAFTDEHFEWSADERRVVVRRGA